MPIINVHRYAPSESYEVANLGGMQTYPGTATFTKGGVVNFVLKGDIFNASGTWALFQADGGIVGYSPGDITVTPPSGRTASNIRKNLNRILVTLT